MNRGGRARYAGRWIGTWPIATMGAVLLAGLLALAVAVVQQAWRSPLQRYYLSSYLASTLGTALGLQPLTYTLWEAIPTRGPAMLAREGDVAPAPSAADGRAVFGPSVAARTAGTRIAPHTASYRHADVRNALRRTIYGQGLGGPFLWPLVVGGWGLLSALLWALPLDRQRGRAKRQGRRLKGAELVTAAAFSRRHTGDGLTFAQTSGAGAVIPRDRETSHVLLTGDTGTGKSTIIRQILDQVHRRGETAIVYDPAREYVPSYYRPDRGDVLLNPLDARSPYWTPGDEVVTRAEALTIATALFPSRPHETNPFFTDASRRIFAHLLTARPTAQQLVDWITDDAALDQRLQGSGLASIIDAQAPAQRSGVLAALSLVADALQLCPPAEACAGRWSATRWAQQRTGWIFLTSTPETRERLVPLQSLWLDTLILRLMGVASPATKTWLIVDELATLSRLPQLHTAITEGRKAQLALVIGFQGKAQLEHRYSHDAETMLSQPATKLFLRTSEPRAAKWASDTIGEVETERLTESRQDGGWSRGRSTGWALDRRVEPLVLPSELSGLPNLHAYLKLENAVTRLTLAYWDRPIRHSGFVARPERAAPMTRSVDPVIPVAVERPESLRLY